MSFFFFFLLLCRGQSLFYFFFVELLRVSFKDGATYQTSSTKNPNGYLFLGVVVFAF